MRPPHLTTIAAALMVSGGGIWTLAMTGQSAYALGGPICGLHAATAPAVHCGWCYAALAMMAAGVVMLAFAGARMLSPHRTR